ncbi:MAG: AAA family ATPase [Bacteroidetes Order II. Incertae sedis bacterium]|jgi:MoxR-like ATPase|nr:AAA family ATPase [Bacteroidetes Order II. bacterium]MDG1754923.1 MoxR family ATPase [Rhodothermales bacterium]MBT4052891.1 AAA family ATPase [Bacteroidetes Order II. bacterium]MBT4601713.1 AAA family ATPase [Bacteroidetes Order II. bacterium]MBT5250594.1 AAA family ATPase [Bacteroidetes Order II. bacterium]
MEVSTSPETVEELHSGYKKLSAEIGKVIIGQDDIVKQIFISMICRGHALLVGVPGLAKTLLIHTIADVMDLDFSRIQFTPDLMPSDITGTEIIEEDATTGRRQFKFVKGPVFANVVLADEINRTPPKTQAALLEAMQEHRVTAAGHTFSLPEPFFVLATQNPIEQEGTYPLPEAQLDRFMFNLWLDYPTFDQEVEVVRQTTSANKPQLNHIMSAADIHRYQHLVRQIPVADNVIEYAVKLVGQTRPDGDLAPQFIKDYLSYGAGPRASQYLILGAKATAALDGRLTPDIKDVHKIAVPVLRHRIVTNFSAEADGISSVNIIERLLASDE